MGPLGGGDRGGCGRFCLRPCRRDRLGGRSAVTLCKDYYCWRPTAFGTHSAPVRHHPSCSAERPAKAPGIDREQAVLRSRPSAGYLLRFLRRAPVRRPRSRALIRCGASPLIIRYFLVVGDANPDALGQWCQRLDAAASAPLNRSPDTAPRAATTETETESESEAREQALARDHRAFDNISTQPASTNYLWPACCTRPVPRSSPRRTTDADGLRRHRDLPLPCSSTTTAPSWGRASRHRRLNKFHGSGAAGAAPPGRRGRVPHLHRRRERHRATASAH